MVEELDELNRLFTSKNIEDVIKFYDHFDTAEQLIEWMKNRPSAPMKIYEVEGEKDIVVVIPTPNHEGELAKNCANNIFKGQQIVFIESNGPFFNYARSCNYGLKYALKYNPKWVILSGYDVSKIESIKKLKSLIKFSDSDLIILNPIYGHSFLTSVSESTVLMDIYRSIKFKSLHRLVLKFGIKYFTPTMKFPKNILYNPKKKFLSFTNFAIFNPIFIKDHAILFDPNFINGSEDIYLCYSFYKDKDKLSIIDYNLGDVNYSSLGKGKLRLLKSLASLIYFNSLIKSDL